MIRHSLLAAAALAAATAAALSALPAEARPHGRFVSVQGHDGRGYIRSRWVNRGDGYAHVRRGFQANDGRGYRYDRSRSWGDGAYHGSVDRRLNDGRSVGRDLDLRANGDGTVSYDFSRHRLDGSTVSRSGSFDDPRF